MVSLDCRSENILLSIEIMLMKRNFVYRLLWDMYCVGSATYICLTQKTEVFTEVTPCYACLICSRLQTIVLPTKICGLYAGWH